MVSLSDTTAGRAAVLGSPVGHSLSPVLHQAAYRALNLNGWRYDAYQVDEAALPAFLSGLSPEAGRWAGLSLTMPLKRAVIPLLDQISDTAASVEAVNTVVFHPDGRRLGENTDIPGMLAALRDLLPADDRWRHRHGSPGHGRDHVLPALVPPHATLPVVGGRLALGTWQFVVVVDTNRDNPRRTVRLSFLG